MKKNPLTKGYLFREIQLEKVRLALLLGEPVNNDFASKEGIKNLDSLIEYIRLNQHWEIHYLNENGVENYFLSADVVENWRQWFLEYSGDSTYAGNSQPCPCILDGGQTAAAVRTATHPLQSMPVPATFRNDKARNEADTRRRW